MYVCGLRFFDKLFEFLGSWLQHLILENKSLAKVCVMPFLDIVFGAVSSIG